MISVTMESQFINIVRINIGLPVITKILFKCLMIPTQKLLIKIFLIVRVSRDAVTTRNVSECIEIVLL
jgi:hypothetical protein